MNGIRLIEMLTEHFRKHKSQGRALLFEIELNGEAVFFTPTQIAETGPGVVVTLRRVIQ